MINKENKKIPLKRLVSVLILSAIVTACSTGNGSSNSNNSNNENGDVSSLQLVAPKTTYSLPSGIGTGYMVVNNPTNQAVKNLHYSLTNQVGSGQQVAIDSVSAAACAEVAAYSQCNVKVIVPAGAVAGSVGYEVDNNGTNLLSRLGKVLKADMANNIVASGIEQASYNKLSGADGITLSYYHTVINGTPYILVSGLVASANAGTFNKIVLVNGSGTVLPNQELISPVSNTQGSTFNILLPIPSGNNISQTIKVQTQQVSGRETTVVSTATSGTCTDVYTLNSASTGTTSINLGNVTASWTDSSGYNNQTIQGTTVYADLSMLPPAITITRVDNWQTVMGSAYAFIATITGGSSTVTPAVTGIGSTVSPVSCDLDSSALATSSCTFIISPYTGAGKYSFWDPASIANSTNVNDPSNAYPSTTGISLQVTADNGAIINNGATQPFSITGTVIAPYVYLAAPEEGAASATNTGITWGTNGTVSTRFENGSQSGGGTCTDSVKDNLTGLEWLKNPNEVCSSKCNWSSSNASGSAQKAIVDFNSAGGKCGYTNWRLPTITELLSLINYAETDQAAWLTNQGFTNVQSNNYWSSTPGGTQATYAWYISFLLGGSNVSGSVGSNLQSTNYYVWTVRGRQ